MRNYFILCMSALALLSACKKEVPKTNVLLIYTDDLNDRLGCYGDSIAITPHIDHLAKEGVLFKNAYCQQPLCGPSRSSTLTGFRPATIGVNTLNKHFREDYPNIYTLPQVFRENGYFTGRSGKVFHQGVPDAIASQSAGADDPKAWDIAVDVPGYELNSNGYYYNATPWETHHVGAGGAVAWLRAEKEDEKQHDYNVATEVINMMDKAGEKPFFLAAGFVRPHVPLVAPKRYFEMYDSVEIPLPVGIANDRADMPAIAYRSWAANFNLTDNQIREAIRAYYACISFVDDQVGRLVQALKDRNIWENTIIVFVSDHGYQLGSHEMWFKNYLFRESLISPLIFRVPESRKIVVDEAVELLDIYPSLCDIAGLKYPEEIEGQSFAGALLDSTLEFKNFAISECMRGDKHAYSIYNNRWSYMYWDGEGEELYDLKTDPHQLVNLIEKEHDVALKMKEHLFEIVKIN